MRLFTEADFAFIGLRRRAYVVSAIIIAIGLGSIAIHGGLNAGVEFTGGTQLRVRFSETFEVAQIRDLLNAQGIEGAQIQPLRGGVGSTAESEFLIRMRSVSDDGEITDVRDEVENALAASLDPSVFEIVSGEGIGPRVGSELQTKATLAVLLSFLLTLIYLAFRFEWRFGVAAVIATVHDIFITFGFISLLNIEITLAIVAAILTIIGYSLNDTIVVFDRVRENLRKKRKEPYEETLDRSINETLPRTVLTSGTTLVALLSLAILGGPVIRPFAVVLILGVLVGTYSSIFVASPALLEIHERARRRAARAAHATG